ncbi:MAG: nucleotidyltransferase family protein [Burkholderiales bacterium]
MLTRAILLAAGSGSRFGGGKLLAPLADGTPVGLASWRNLNSALGRCVAVVRTGDTALSNLLQSEGATVIECADAQSGMSRSLITGLRATGNSSGWVVALGDMPYIKPATISKVAEAIERGELIAQPVCNGKRGNPVGLSARLLPELMGIKGDEGAREVVRRHAGEICLIECDDDSGILRDIDTRDDLV